MVVITAVHICGLVWGHIEVREAVMVEGGCGVWKVHPVDEDIHDALIQAIALIHL